MKFGSVCSGKPCTHCKEVKPLDMFHRQTKASDGRASWCKQCANSIYRERRKRNYSQENKRKWQLMTRYKMTPDQVAALLNHQGGKCAICKVELVKYHVDHSHESGIVRGLLCHKCNIRLGGWDDKVWRDTAMKYAGFSV